MKASNPQSVKQSNLLYLIELIKGNGPISKRELAELSGLSVVTINKLIPDLLEKELVLPFSDEVVTGGRHAMSYVFNFKKFYSLIIKMVEKNNQMYFFFYLCDLKGKIIEEKEISGEDLQWSNFLTIIDAWKKVYPAIQSIVLGIPGVEMNGTIKLVDYPMLQGRKLKEELANHFNCKIQIENDVNAAILGYFSQQNMDQIIAGIYYPIGFPPGGGVAIRQKIIKGKNNYVGEVASLPLSVDWQSVVISKVNLKEHLREISQTFISLYDPHEIIVYVADDRLSLADVNEINLELKNLFPILELPQIKLSKSFNTDYLLGLISLGVADLNQVLSLKI